MNFAEAFEAPVVEKILGNDVTFPVLWNEDYLPWVAEITKDRRTRSKALIPPLASDIDKFRMSRIAEFDEPSLDAIAEKVWTMAGAIKVLNLSLAKAGIADPLERKKIIKGVPPRRTISLAVEVSALFEKKEPVAGATDKQETTDPNPPSEPDSENADPDATGS